MNADLFGNLELLLSSKINLCPGLLKNAPEKIDAILARFQQEIDLH